MKSPIRARWWILLSLHLALTAQATPVQRLRRLVDTEVSRVAEQLDRDDTVTIDGTAQQWSLRNLYLRLQATIGIQLPLVASLQMVPQIELVWHRKTPNTTR